jgi:rhamnogalacturonan endolyase
MNLPCLRIYSVALFSFAALFSASSLMAQNVNVLAPQPAVPGVPIPAIPPASALPAIAKPAAQPVTLTEDAQTYTLSNGIVTAVISKNNGHMNLLQYHGMDMLGHNSGTPGGYWETNPSSAVDTVTIDPATNGGARAEVSIKGPSGGFIQEDRYAMGAGESGVYTYAIYSHTADMGRASMPENRYGAKLNPTLFDWLSVDANRNLLMASSADWDAGTQMGGMKEARYLNTGIHKGQVEHKYDYCGYQFFTPAFGWSSTKQHLGIWFINPTVEFLSGGATKDELDCHLDDNTGGDPLILDYWRGTHYGGTDCSVDDGEVWSKVVGPIYLYCNYIDQPSAKIDDNSNALFYDALAQAAKESDNWPYDWVQGVDYPHKAERGTVSGQLSLNDPQANTTKMPNLFVGLAYPDESTDDSKVDWQKDAKHYEFWVRGDEDGHFTIPKVRPGTYELHAFADGVLGEYSQMNVTVKPGDTLDLGKLVWQPVRYGKQLWDIGIPNRYGVEFLDGDNFWHWGWYIQYAKLFPNDVNYTIGKSDYKKDWFFEQVPHVENFDGANSDTRGRATTWTINFHLDATPRGSAVLRLAICGVGNSTHIDVGANGQPVGSVLGLRYINATSRDGIGGYWIERDVTFDASVLKQGDNTVTLTVPAGSLTNGIMYDYLRLELNELYKPDGTKISATTMMTTSSSVALTQPAGTIPPLTLAMARNSEPTGPPKLSDGL